MIIKFSFKYGLLVGAAIFVYILLELALGLHGKHLHIGQYTGYFRYFFPRRENLCRPQRFALRTARNGGYLLERSRQGVGHFGGDGNLRVPFRTVYLDCINPQFVQAYIDFSVAQL